MKRYDGKGNESDTGPWVCVDDAAKLERKLAQAQRHREELIEALSLPLLFHRGGFWSAPEKERWMVITGKDEATTKVMCDHIRALLARIESEVGNG